jgi:hypothetical protein
MEIDVEPEHLFSLEDCSNLSKLTLNMEYSESCSVQDSISILSTLDPARSGGLGKIALKASTVRRWFNEDGQVDGEEDWEGLDAVLSKLAKATINMGEEKLTFTLVVAGWDSDSKFMPMVGKWLPKLLPRFNGLGLLHVHSGRGSSCQPGCPRHDEPDEDF